MLANEIITNNYTKAVALAALEALEEQAKQDFFAKKGATEDTFNDIYSPAKKTVEAVKELTVYVAEELDGGQVARLGKKARELFGEEIFLEFKVDPTLTGGAALVWNGIYKDYSVRARFEEKKGELRELYLKYLE